LTVWFPTFPLSNIYTQVQCILIWSQF
jgi:hypothetical protein